jgi:hypothetical protein
MLLPALALEVAGKALVSRFAGPAFGPAPDLPLAALAPGFAAAAAPLVLFHLAVDSRAHRATVAGLAAAAAGVSLSGGGVTPLAGLAGGLAGTALLLQYHGAAAICRWSPPLSSLRPHREVPAPVPPGDPEEEVELSMVVPCHNAGPGLRDFLVRLEAELGQATSHEVVVVSDGSTDDTLRVARERASATVRVLHYPQRSGKGHALRVGLSRARGTYVGFIDADGDIDPAAIGPFLSLARMYRPDIVLGSKRHPLSRVSYPALRRVMSWTYHKLARVLFRVNVRDTQTGLKLVRRDVLAAVLPRMLEKRYAFDLELLVVARMLGFTRVFEAPVRIDYRFSSHVDLQAALRILLDTAAIFYRRYVLNTYRHLGDRLSAPRSAPPVPVDAGP